MNNRAYVDNRADTAEVRQESLGGTDYLVAPVVSIQRGVMNGELVLPEEFGAFPGAWDGRPVILDHPYDAEGLPVSANTPDLMVKQVVGQIYNTTSNGKLSHEMWVDILRAQQTTDGRELLQRLKSATPVEVSTAYYRDLEEVEGEHGGVPYVGIARNIRPDHLAVLLHGQGACNWRDGCGAPRVNAEASFDERIMSVRDAWRVEHPFEGDMQYWVEEVFEDHLVAEVGGKFYKVNYNQADDKITFSTRDEWEQVKEQREWVPVANKADTPVVLQAIKHIGAELKEFITHERSSRMHEKVRAILDSNVIPLEAEQLEGLSEEQLDGLIALIPNEETVDEEETTEEPVVDVRSLLDAEFAEFGGLDGVKARLADNAAKEDLKREEIVGRLAANEQCALTREQLDRLDLETLKSLEQTFRPQSYEGLGGEPQINEDVEAFLVPDVFGGNDG